MINKPQSDVNWKVLFSTRNYLFYALGAVVVAALIVLLGVVPQVQAIFGLRADIAQESPKLEKLRQKLVELEQIRFAPEFAQVEVVNKALPSKKPLLELLGSLQAAASVTEVLVTDVELSPGDLATTSAQSDLTSAATPTPAPATPGVKSAADVDRLVVSMQVSGHQNQVRDFMTTLEKLTPFTTITQLGVERVQDDENPDADMVNAELTTETYFFTKSISATLEEQLPELTDTDRQVLSTISSFVANEVPTQNEVIGGGLLDLFGADPLPF